MWWWRPSSLRNCEGAVGRTALWLSLSLAVWIVAELFSPSLSFPQTIIAAGETSTTLP
jgi:hypothetical protein